MTQTFRLMGPGQFGVVVAPAFFLLRGSGMDAFGNLRKLVENVAPDIAAAEGGDRAAGTRARKAMQAVRRLAQEVRVECLAATKESGAR